MVDDGILSVTIGARIRGKDINDWCIDQITFHGSHEKDARRLSKKNYRDYKWYEAIHITESSECNPQPILVFRSII